MVYYTAQKNIGERKERRKNEKKKKGDRNRIEERRETQSGKHTDSIRRLVLTEITLTSFTRVFC